MLRLRGGSPLLPRPEHVLLHVPLASCVLGRRAQAFTRLPKKSLLGLRVRKNIGTDNLVL